MKFRRITMLYLASVLASTTPQLSSAMEEEEDDGLIEAMMGTLAGMKSLAISFFWSPETDEICQQSQYLIDCTTSEKKCFSNLVPPDDKILHTAWNKVYEGFAELNGPDRVQQVAVLEACGISAEGQGISFGTLDQLKNGDKADRAIADSLDNNRPPGTENHQMSTVWCFEIETPKPAGEALLTLTTLCKKPGT